MSPKNKRNKKRRKGPKGIRNEPTKAVQRDIKKKPKSSKIKNKLSKDVRPVANLQHSLMNINQLNAPKSSKKSEGNESLRSRMEKRLQAAKFKMINEDLGTLNVEDPKDLFNNDQETYVKYLETQKEKSQTWPWHPLHSIIEIINKAPESAIIVDFGCGEAEIAQNVKQSNVHSFDLFSVNEFVTPRNMKDTGLPDAVADVGVFCNSLMASEIGDFIMEANRVLKPGAKLLIAEVASRFGKDLKNLKKFKFGMRRYGFLFSKLLSKGEDNQHFILLSFVKKSKVLKLRDGSLAPLELLPSKYKPR